MDRSAVLSYSDVRRIGVPALPDRGAIDERLVRDCLNGDQAAWSALLRRYKNLIYSIPIKYGFSADEANDVFQDVCVELLAELPRLREPRALPKWLAQVTAHRCARLKQVALRLPVAEGTADAVEEVPAAIPDVEDLLLETEREQALRDAVTSLSPRCRRLIERLFFDSPPRPYAEVARELNLASGSIGFIRGRCLTRLRTALRDHGFR